MALEDLYGRDSNLAEEKEIFRYEIPLKDFLKAVKKVFKEKGYRPGMLAEPECRPLISDTHQVFRKAVENGVADNDLPDEMARRLDHDTFIFSGFKVHHELSEAGLSLRDENGKLKSYAAFEKDVTSIHEKYNRNYLRSEYNFAVASAQMAANWKEVEAGKNRYDLQYRTAGDYRVRRTHKALQDITLPADDPFWDKYYPPNGWSCRCTAVEVLKGKYPVSDSKDAIMKGEKATSSLDRFGNNKDAIFRFNPGKDGKIFPPKHPYLPKGCGDCKKGIRNLAYDPDSEQCKVCLILAKIATRQKVSPEEKEDVYALPVEKQFNIVHTDKGSGHSVLQHRLVDEKGEDYRQVLAVAKAYAEEGNCKINPVVDKNARKGREIIYHGITDNANPDLTTEKYGYVDVKSPHRKNNIVRNANDACKQGGVAVITDLAMDEKITIDEVGKFSDRIFSEKNVNQKGEQNYTKDTVHWYVNGKLHKCNRPEKK